MCFPFQYFIKPLSCNVDTISEDAIAKSLLKSRIHSVGPGAEHNLFNRASFQYDRYEIRPKSDNGVSGEPTLPSTFVSR